MAKKRHGVSYQKRVHDVNKIYDEHSRSGLSNREIWRRYIYPAFGMCERTFYNLINASADDCNKVPSECQQLLLFPDLFSYNNEKIRDNNKQYPE